MGCNAWNHAHDCDCGFGGQAAGVVSAEERAAASGLKWLGGHSPAFESFVIPNALCPVCGERVFFYQSEDGGRVFFDHLGPPWPKHPCTDSSVVKVRADNKAADGWRLDAILPAKWLPLVSTSAQAAGDCTMKLSLRRGLPLPAPVLFIPNTFSIDRPIFWRWSPSEIGVLELSSFIHDVSGGVKEQRITVPSWISHQNEFIEWQVTKNEPHEPEQFTSIAWARSFACIRREGGERQFNQLVDWPLAIELLGLASERGSHRAMHNLGVAILLGNDRKKDFDKAFYLLSRAAELGHHATLFWLRQCVLNGYGCEVDLNEAGRLHGLYEECSLECDHEDEGWA